MSDDLISRKSLLECAEYDDKGRLVIPYRKVENAPTAFDKEKVIQEIREKVSDCYLEYCGKYNNCLQCRADEAVKIVEKGGLN